MKHDYLVKYFIILVIVLLYKPLLNAQCPSPTENLNVLEAIQNSSDTYAEKIQKLFSLQNCILAFNPTKDSVNARILHRIGDYYSKLGNHNTAITYTKEAININSSKIKGAQKDYLVNSYFNLGIFYRELNLYSQSHIYFDSCIFLGVNNPAKCEISMMAYEQKAFNYFKTADYHKSIETARIGILRSKKANHWLYVGIILYQKAQAHLAMNQYDNAEIDIKAALPMLYNHNAEIGHLATAYAIYAALLTKKKETALAVTFYNKALDINSQLNDWPQYIRNITDLGNLYKNELNKPSFALACYNKGINYIEKTNDNYQLAALYNNIGESYATELNYLEALVFFQKALNTLPIGFKSNNLSSNPTVSMLEQTNNHFYVFSLLENKGYALLQLYKIENKKEFLQFALNAFMAADKAIDQMRYNQYNETSKLFWREQTKKLYEKAVETCYLLNNVDNAFYFFEKSRAVLLNDKLSELGANNMLPQSEMRKEQYLRSQIIFLQKKLSTFKSDDKLYENIQQDLLVTQEKWENFVKKLEVNYPVYYQYKYENTVPSILNIENYLWQNNQSLIELFTGDTAVYVLSIINNKKNLYKFYTKDIQLKIRDLLVLSTNKSLLNQNFARYCTIANQIYNILIKPLHLKKGRVVISPDEYFIPFDALLYNPNDPNSYLVKDFAFSYIYSANFLLKENFNNRSAKNMFLGVAPVAYKSYLKQHSLEGADISLTEIQKRYNSTNILLKDKATRQQFLLNFPFYKVIQLYTHADADSSGNEPVLYLQDSVIYVSEIQNLTQVQTKLIILSACNTGVGKQAKGEGVFSLARAFTAVGIPSTITTLWKIENKSTYELNQLFHKYLAQGRSKDIALQQAKLDFLKNKSDQNLPYYWAASILLGNSDALIDNNQSSNYILYITIIIMLVLIFFYSKRYSIKNKTFLIYSELLYKKLFRSLTKGTSSGKEL